MSTSLEEEKMRLEARLKEIDDKLKEEKAKAIFGELGALKEQIIKLAREYNAKAEQANVDHMIGLLHTEYGPGTWDEGDLIPVSDKREGWFPSQMNC